MYLYRERHLWLMISLDLASLTTRMLVESGAAVTKLHQFSFEQESKAIKILRIGREASSAVRVFRLFRFLIYYDLAVLTKAMV